MSGRTGLPRQRQDVIQSLLRTRRFATVRELASAVGVSEMTVRRDLHTLQSDGHVHRVFGGAHDANAAHGVATIPEQRVSERMAESREAKTAIARTAAALVRDGDTVGLDGSTTAVHLARRLRGRAITVVTNNLSVVDELAGGAASVFVPGGMLRETTRTLVGETTVAALGPLNADIVFFSCTGLHAAAGISDSNVEEVAVKRALFRLAERRVALVDGSKFGRLSLLKLIDLDDVESLVTEALPDADLLRALNASGTRIRHADG